MKGNASSCERLKVAVTGARSRFAHTRKRACGLAALAVLVMIVTSARAQPVCFSAHLNELGPIFSSAGHHVAISENTAVVGAHNAWPSRVFVFDHVADLGWLESQVLFQPDGAPSDGFGVRVAVGDDIIAVVSGNWDVEASDPGSVYVFRRVDQVWGFEQKIILADGPGDSLFFGRNVVINDGRIAVGASGGGATFDGGGETWGRVHIFEHDGESWVQTHMISKDHLHPSNFGTTNAVAMSGDLLIVGAPSETDVPTCKADPEWDLDWNGPCEFNCHTGRAYIFRYDPDLDEWIEEAALLPESVKCYDRFGRAVGIDGNYAIVSTQDASLGRRVYMFEFDQVSGEWIETAEIHEPNIPINANYGRNIDLVGGTALVGASFGGNPCSSAFVYERASSGQWVKRAVLTPQSTSGCNSFGDSVALGGGWAILGAPTQSPGGAAYIYDMQPPIGDLTCDETVGVNDLLELLGSWGECPAPGDGISGCPGDLNGDGTVGVADLLVLLANWG